MREKLEMLKEISQRFSQLEDEILHLEARLPRRPGGRANEALESLKELLNRYKTRLAEFRINTDQMWVDLQVGLEVAWDDLKQAFENLKELWK